MHPVMSRRFPPRPALSVLPPRRLRRTIVLLASLTAPILGLSSCGLVPEPVAGVPAGDAWVALPLRSWLAENRGVPEAMVACFSAECPQRLAVGVFRLSGADAEAAAAVLRQPDRLVAYLRSRDARETGAERRGIRTQVTARPLRDAKLEGFAIMVARPDGARAPAHGAALGARSGGTLRFVLVVGEDAEGVEATARRVAAKHLGS